MRMGLVFSVLLGLASAAPAQDSVKERLDKSPRHHEWVEVKNGDRKVACFVVFPEVKDKATAVIVIHENKGLTDWVRGVADQLAEAGYIAVAPDCLSGMGPKGGNTDSFASAGDATKAIGKISQMPNQVTGDLNAAADYALSLKACNGKLAVCGYCWGGGQCFRFATNRKDLKAAFVFYGMTKLDKETVDRIQCPVYGFYGGNDARINESIPETTTLMKAAGKKYEPVTYDGAGHGFMRAGEEMASGANRDARNAAWERWKMILKKL
jgi:carboxymethylenebutenolidase